MMSFNDNIRKKGVYWSKSPINFEIASYQLECEIQAESNHRLELRYDSLEKGGKNLLTEEY